VRARRSAWRRPELPGFSGGQIMPNLGAPTQVAFLISLFLVLLAILSLFVINIPVISMYGFWVAVAGYAVLAVACLMKGM
jgi:hypothetical protein